MTAVIFRYCLTLAFRGEKDMKKEVMEEIKKELDDAWGIGERYVPRNYHVMMANA